MAEIDIAMPCYNAEPWLDRCMESLLVQQITDWRLVARDDGSSDGTAGRLAAWNARLAERMTLLRDSAGKNLGVVGNYNLVLGGTTARWVMTADPDDVWLPYRLQRTLAALKEAEDRLGPDAPLAVCTDARVIDDQERPVASSYWRWARHDPARTKRVAHVAMESPALGSTMAVNRALLDIALPIAAASPYQDWWLALVAVAFGGLLALPEPTILYRRHSSNSADSPLSSSWSEAFWRVMESPLAPKRRLEKVLFKQAAPQAAAFLETYRARLESDDADALGALVQLRDLGPFDRRMMLWRHHLWFASPVKNLGLVAFC